MADGTIEIITGHERRRRWSTEEKLRIVAESEDPGACVKAMAIRHDVYPSLVFNWRRQVREGRLSAAGSAGFMPSGCWHRPGRRRPSAACRGIGYSLRARLDELEARKKALAADLAAQDAPAPTVALHPKAAEAYREQIADLEDALNDPELRMEASDALRALIE